MACYRFLDFPPAEYTLLQRRQQNVGFPKVSEMISQITEYRKLWNEKMKSNTVRNVDKLHLVKQKMYLRFLYETQIQENIGIRDTKSFLELCKVTLSEGNECLNSDSVPDSLEMDMYIEENSETHDQKKKTETINLLRAYRGFRNMVKQEDSDYDGIIDVENCIIDCHRILMKDIDGNRTAPGQFSVLQRKTEFEGKTYFYPRYNTVEIAFSAVQTLVDNYNEMMKEISLIEEEKLKVESLFKCASVFIFGFLMIHPFSDGNGRLARLLCNHCLRMFFPFPSAIYNVFSPSSREDYLSAIVDARKSLDSKETFLECSNDAIAQSSLYMEQKPAELCSLLIESCWFSWRYFLREIGEDIPVIK